MDTNRIHKVLCRHTVGSGQPIVVDLENSNGAWLVDKLTGNKYLDCASQYASQALGWNHPALLDIDFGRATTVKLANPDLFSEEYAVFVDAFSKIIPDFNKSFFIDGGALGVENALKAAFDWKAQRSYLSNRMINMLDVIHFKQAFHGRSGYTLSLTNTTPNKTALFPKFNWTRVKNPKITSDKKAVVVDEQECLSEIKFNLEQNMVAAIIIEPIQGEGGDNHFRKEFFQALRKLADQYETMLIFDEVQTGVGMTGKMWCYEHFGVIPDLMVFGKKTQVCGFCSTKKIDNVKHNVLNTAGRICSTWGGNIVDMVRFTTIAKVIRDDKLVENAATVGSYLLKKLKAISGIEEVRGRGLMIAFDLETPKKREQVLKKLKKNMLILPCGDKSIRLRPHLTFMKKEADLAVEFIEGAI